MVGLDASSDTAVLPLGLGDATKPADKEAIPFRRSRPHAAPGVTSSGQEDWLGGSSVRTMDGAGVTVPESLAVKAGPLVWPSRLLAIRRPATPVERDWARASESPW